MEKKLVQLFDFQRFEKNAALEKIIAETESRAAAALSDEELGSVFAAGEYHPDSPLTGNGKNEEEKR